MTCKHGHNGYCPNCEVLILSAKVKELDKTLREWENCGDTIMEFITGKKAPLSDSLVIGHIGQQQAEIEELKWEIKNLNSMLQ